MLGLEVPGAAYVMEGGELFLPPLYAVRVLIDIGALGAVVDREYVAGEVTPVDCKAVCLVSFVELGTYVMLF